MTHDYWKIEVRRLLLALSLALALGVITGYWLIGLLVVSASYIGWMLFKLRELQIWLAEGQPTDSMPDSDGAWEQITYLVHRSKQKSKARKKKQRELLERLNSIMAALPDATILLNQEHMIQWSNRAATHLLGIQTERDWGQRIDNLIRTPELATLLESGESREIRFTSPRDESVTLLARLLPVQKNLVLFNVRDISQRIHLQETRKAFFANASHELRTPLTVLAGYLELFDDDADMPGHLIPAVKQAREQAERMQRILSDMLALSRLENDEKRRAADTPIAMPALLQNVAGALADTIAAGSHTLAMQADPTLRLLGNEADLLSLITNLIENAIKHTPPDTHIKVIWERTASGEACLSVEDNGPGIPVQHIGHLTERFYRVDKGRTRDTGGTGLGLAIVKHVMINHGGTLDISSKPGKTCFSACFPLERVAP